MSNEPNFEIVRKVQKLLAVANDRSASEAEAAAFMAKAQALMAEHNLEMATVAAAGGTQSADALRIQASAVDRTPYKWRRELMSAICKVNFVHCEQNWRRKDKQRIFEGFQLIGRQVNVAAARVQFEYLCQAIERLAQDWARQDGYNVFAKPAILFREGCAERLEERVRSEYARLKQEQEDRARSTPSDGRALILLSNVEQDERDLNDDLLYGDPPGTHAARRRENAAKAARVAQLEQEHGISWSAAWDMVNLGKTLAEALAAMAKEMAEEAAETEADKQKREARYAHAVAKYDREANKAALRRADPGYQAGRAAGDDISLNQQIDRTEQRRIRN